LYFTSTKCKVIDEKTRKVIARGYKIPNRLYLLTEKNLGINKRYNSSPSSNLEEKKMVPTFA